MGRGPAKRLQIVSDKSEIQSGGSDSTIVRIKALDEWGNPALDGQVGIETSSGQLVPVNEKTAPKATTPSADLSKPVEQSTAATEQMVVQMENGEADLKLLSVTVLTSLDASDIQDLGFPCDVEALVLHRAKRALEAGCDGVIASGEEARQIRATLGDKLLIVTPGIRPVGSPSQDQKRAVTPREAVLAGADYLVVGRPITRDPDPRKAAQGILSEMEEAFIDPARA